MAKCTYKIIDDDNKLIKKGKLRIFYPNFKDFRLFLRNLTSELPPEERIFIYKMIHFHIFLPPNDIISNQYVDYMNMLDLGMYPPINSIQFINSNWKDLFYKTVYNDRIFKLQMTPESYHTFRQLILDELVDFEKNIHQDFNTIVNETISNMPLRKKLKFKFFHKKIDEAKKEALSKTYEILNKGCKESEKEIVAQKFYEEANNLLEKFNKKRYDSLISRLTIFFNEEYEKTPSEYLIEEIEYINSANSTEEQQDRLIWIFENTSSRSDAFDLMKVDAEYIYLQCFNNYFKNYYTKARKKMNNEERRLYRLMFFQRDVFLGKIPVLDEFFRSFWKNNIELILIGLVIKKNNPLYFEKNKELELKWQEFLVLYPIARQNSPIINKVNDKPQCLDLALKHFNDKENLVIRAFLDNYEEITICANYDITFKECEDLIQRFQKVVRESACEN